MHVCCGLICSCALQAYPERLIGHMLAVRDWQHNRSIPNKQCIGSLMSCLQGMLDNSYSFSSYILED